MEKTKLKIGIDIDEVITEYMRAFLFYLEKTREKKILYEDIFDYSLKGPLEMTQQQVWNLLEEYTSDDVVINLDLVEGSKEAINLLKKQHNLFFITSRNPRTKKATLLFFEKHFPGNKFEIFFSGETWENGNKSKTEICRDCGISLMIEDNPGFAVNCANNGIGVLLIDKPWNKNCEHENIKRVKNWKEILEVLG